MVKVFKKKKKERKRRGISLTRILLLTLLQVVLFLVMGATRL